MAIKAPTSKSKTVKAPPKKAVPPPLKAAAKISAKSAAKPAGKLEAKALAKPMPPVTITLKHLAVDLAERLTLPKKDAEAILVDFFGSVVEHLKAGERVRIAGLGIIEVKNRAVRMGRNPATGEPIQIKASKKLAFRAAKELKEAI
jgi:DNA-binding protein HU-beta